MDYLLVVAVTAMVTLVIYSWIPDEEDDEEDDEETVKIQDEPCDGE